MWTWDSTLAFPVYTRARVQICILRHIHCLMDFHPAYFNSASCFIFYFVFMCTLRFICMFLIHTRSWIQCSFGRSGFRNPKNWGCTKQCQLSAQRLAFRHWIWVQSCKKQNKRMLLESKDQSQIWNWNHIFLSNQQYRLLFWTNMSFKIIGGLKATQLLHIKLKTKQRWWC